MATRKNKNTRGIPQGSAKVNTQNNVRGIENNAKSTLSASVSSEPLQEKIDDLFQQAEKLTEGLQVPDLPAPKTFNLDEFWHNAQIFDSASKRLESEQQQLENQKQAIEVIQNKLQIKQNNLAEQKEEQNQNWIETSRLLKEDRDRLNQQLSNVNHQERQLQEREANAIAGFLTQNRVALSQLEQQIEQLSQEIAQALSKKINIQQQVTEDISQKYVKFEQAISIKEQELEQKKQQLIIEHQPLRKEQNKLEIDRQLLDEERQYFEEKVGLCAAAKNGNLETSLRMWKERYEQSEERQKIFETKLAKYEHAFKKFGQRNPEELLAELQNLYRRNDELEQTLSERPTEAATRRLEALENQQEQWETERFRLMSRVQELERSAATNRIAVTNLETLRDEKEALEASKNYLRSALYDLRISVNDGISQSKERSPFEKCAALDKHENLQIVPRFSQEPIDLAEFAQDLRYRIARSPKEKGKSLYYSDSDIRAFLGGIAMSKLHLLQGISGTGKTSLPIAFARALGQPGQANYKLIEVQAGWRDRQDLIGYYNSFESKFYETEFLTALYEAQCPKFQDQIYIIVLDEMNLSRPEQYFADFLSKLEQESPTLTLNTDLERSSPKLFRNNDTLSIPPNVWFVGTANQDETTLEFADKTYDRAHVMELDRSHESFEIPDLLSRDPISYDDLTSAFKKAQKQYHDQATKAYKFLNDNLSSILESKFKIAWGKRLEDQMGRYIPVVIAAGGSLTEATDRILATKILRKVRDRHDIQQADLIEIKNTIDTYWSELDKGEPSKSLKIIESELNRLDRGV